MATSYGSHTHGISVSGNSSSSFYSDEMRDWQYSPPTTTTTFKLEFPMNDNSMVFNVIGQNPIEQKGEDKMLEKLLDLVFALELSEGDVEEFKKIIGMNEWRMLFQTYQLAKEIKEGLTAETLGYKEPD